VGGRGPLCHRRGPLIQEAPAPRARFTYISDVSRIPDSVMASLRSGPQVRVLVLDCLHYGKHFSHFGPPTSPPPPLPLPCLPPWPANRRAIKCGLRAARPVTVAPSHVQG